MGRGSGGDLLGPGPPGRSCHDDSRRSKTWRTWRHEAGHAQWNAARMRSSAPAGRALMQAVNCREGYWKERRDRRARHDTTRVGSAVERTEEQREGPHHSTASSQVHLQIRPHGKVLIVDGVLYDMQAGGPWLHTLTAGQRPWRVSWRQTRGHTADVPAWDRPETDESKQTTEGDRRLIDLQPFPMLLKQARDG